MITYTDKEYKSTKRYKQGKKHLVSPSAELAHWIQKKWKVIVLNIIYDRANDLHAPRLQVILEYESQARKFHRKLSEFYEELKDSASKERTRALLGYMSRHEQYLDECLAAFQRDVSSNVLDSYYQYDSDATNLREITEFSIKPDMDVEDVVAAAMHFDSCLIKFYREMAARAPSSTVQEVFENLLVMEEHEQLELSKTMLELG